MESSQDTGSTAGTALILAPARSLRRRWPLAVMAGVVLLAGAAGGGLAAVALHALSDPAQNQRSGVDRIETTLAKLAADLRDTRGEIATLQAAMKTGLAKIDQVKTDQAKADQAGARDARLTRISDAVDRLEKLLKSDTSASIAPARTPDPPATRPPADRPAALPGWALRDASAQRALLEYKGELYEAVPGAELPGAGRVQSIRRLDGRWVVSTDRGLISAQR